MSVGICMILFALGVLVGILASVPVSGKHARRKRRLTGEDDSVAIRPVESYREGVRYE